VSIHGSFEVLAVLRRNLFDKRHNNLLSLLIQDVLHGLLLRAKVLLRLLIVLRFFTIVSFVIEV
jgi:hypothetical protein